MDNELKPCPFCGGKDIYVTEEPGYLDYSTAIFCNTCKTIVKLEINDQEGLGFEQTDRAVKAWNRRFQNVV